MLTQFIPRTGQSASNTQSRPSATWGTVVTSGAANTLSTNFTELVASSSFDTCWVTISFPNTGITNAGTNTLCNLYVGAAGSEQLLIPYMLCGFGNFETAPAMPPKSYQFPLWIPAGSRLSAKTQSQSASKAVAVSVWLEGGGRPATWVGRKVETLGISTASSAGTVVDVTTVTGSLTVIGTTGSADWGYLLVGVGGETAGSFANSWTQYDVGSGGSVLKGLAHWSCVQHSAERMTTIDGGVGRFTRIAPGTQLQIRATGSNSGPDDFDFAIYGVI